MNLTYDAKIKPEHRKLIHSYMKELLWLVPGWVQYLTIYVQDGSSPNVLASIEVDYKYRFGKMFIRTAWLNIDASDQIETLIHELIHLHSSLPTDYAGKKLELFIDDDDVKEAIFSDLREREEQMTQDLAYAIYNKLYAEKYDDQ